MRGVLSLATVGLASFALAGALPAAASAEVAYSFLDVPVASFTLTAAPITSTETLASDFCSVEALCSSVKFTPTSSYDEVTLLNGSNFFFSPAAFTTFGAYMEQSTPTSSNAGAEFSNLSGGTTSAAPEPSTWLLMFAGLGAVGLMLRRAKKTMSFRFKDAFSA